MKYQRKGGENNRRRQRRRRRQAKTRRGSKMAGENENISMAASCQENGRSKCGENEMAKAAVIGVMSWHQ
jgi:hypothetical protein